LPTRGSRGRRMSEPAGSPGGALARPARRRRGPLCRLLHGGEEMTGRSSSRVFRAVIGGVVALVVAGCGWVVWRQLYHRPPADAQAQVFRECAEEVGLEFRMRFLPNEQGETFKINLYDHGCGLAVGDFDGDGFDDIYLVNQLGPNALYRNKGDGTFEDVTAK